MLSGNTIICFALVASYLGITAYGIIIDLHRGAQAHPLKERDVCMFEASPDFYGLGIRLGIYLQWAASCIVLGVWWKCHNGGGKDDKKDSEAEVSYSIATGLIFLLSVFVAMMVSTAQDSIHIVESGILLYICLGSLSLLLLLAYALILEELHFGAIRHFFHTLLVAAIASFNVWFWFRGVDPLGEEHCDGFLFLFARVNMLGPARTWFKIQSILVLCYTICMASLVTYYFIRKYKETGGENLFRYLIKKDLPRRAGHAPPGNGPPRHALPEQHIYEHPVPEHDLYEQPPVEPAEPAERVWGAAELSEEENPMNKSKVTREFKTAAGGDIYVCAASGAVREAGAVIISAATEVLAAKELESSELVQAMQYMTAVNEAEAELSKAWNAIKTAAGKIISGSKDTNAILKGLLETAAAALDKVERAFSIMINVVEELRRHDLGTRESGILKATWDTHKAMEIKLKNANKMVIDAAAWPLKVDKFAKYFLSFVIVITVGHLWWSVIAIELTIAWNSVAGVYVIRSTSQLIPFIAGIAGLVRIIFFSLRYLPIMNFTISPCCSKTTE